MERQAWHCFGLYNVVVLVVELSVGAGGSVVTSVVVVVVVVPRHVIGRTAQAKGLPSIPWTTTAFPDAVPGSTRNIVAPTASLLTGMYKWRVSGFA